jgi:hypothetical protein
MLNIISHLGNANQNYDEILFHCRMAIIKNKNNKCWLRYGKKKKFLYAVGENVSIAIMENSMEFLKKLKINPPYDSAIPLLGKCPRK